MELNPLHIPACPTHGMSLMQLGRIEEAIPFMERAVRFTPNDPRNSAFVGGLAFAYFVAGEFQKAAETSNEALKGGARAPGSKFVHLSALSHLGDLEAAKSARANLDIPEIIHSNLGVQRSHIIRTPFIFESIKDDLRKAGLKIGDD